ncbi:MAG TPA: xanthine dehydrogenase family protein subunit M [Syntrophales bacterium]|nr:xanthine dehydrogenase family protein subunit M [Syntrophales bacterium]
MREVHLPRTPEELWPILDGEPEVAVYAGGTDLIVRMGTGRPDPPSLVCLERMESWRGVRDESGALWLGACTTFSELLRSGDVCGRLPLLAAAVATLGSPQVRNMGTLGGNLCTASPAGDSLPPLYVMDAAVELQSSRGTRRMPIREFITGPGRTQLQRGEVLTGVRVGIPQGFQVHRFEKVGQRKALACAIASMAALLKLSGDGAVSEGRIAWGSVGPTVVVSAEVEGFLRGRKVTPATVEEAAALAERAVAPIDDVRGSAAYRRQVAGNLLRKLLYETL